MLVEQVKGGAEEQKFEMTPEDGETELWALGPDAFTDVLRQILQLTKVNSDASTMVYMTLYDQEVVATVSLNQEKEKVFAQFNGSDNAGVLVTRLQEANRVIRLANAA